MEHGLTETADDEWDEDPRLCTDHLVQVQD